MRVKVEYHNIQSRRYQFLEQLILNGKVKLWEISRRERIKNHKYYIYSLRYYRDVESSVSGYIDILKILADDITCLKSQSDNLFFARLETILSNYVTCSPFDGVEEFENYKKFVFENIL